MYCAHEQESGDAAAAAGGLACSTMVLPLGTRVVRASDEMGSWEPWREGRPGKQELDVVMSNGGGGGADGGF